MEKAGQKDSVISKEGAWKIVDYKTDGEKLNGSMRTERESEGARDREWLCSTTMLGVKRSSQGFARHSGSTTF